MAQSSSQTVIYAALTGNLLVALTKFVAAAFTGSSAMLSEGVHSLVDTGNQGLLLYGQHRAGRAPDEQHPLGYGREIYFWSFVVALLLFALGAGVSLYEGIVHIREPHPITNPAISYVVLGLASVFEGASWYVALREFRKTKGSLDYVEALQRSKNPPIFVVLLEDTAALIGIAIALIGTFASVQLEMPVLDGAASIGISIVLGSTAAFLARESKGLLIGEPAGSAISKDILDLARQRDGIDHVNGVMTVHLAPDEIVATLSVEFADRLTAPDIEQRIVTLEGELRERHPDIIAVFIKPQSRQQFRHFRSDLSLANASTQ